MQASGGTAAAGGPACSCPMWGSQSSCGCTTMRGASTGRSSRPIPTSAVRRPCTAASPSAPGFRAGQGAGVLSPLLRGGAGQAQPSGTCGRGKGRAGAPFRTVLGTPAAALHGRRRPHCQAAGSSFAAPHHYRTLPYPPLRTARQGGPAGAAPRHAGPASPAPYRCPGSQRCPARRAGRQCRQRSRHLPPRTRLRPRHASTWFERQQSRRAWSRLLRAQPAKRCSTCGAVQRAASGAACGI